jgi:ribonuclease J
MTAITVHDGARGIGGNKILVEENGRGVFLDFGKNFGKYGLYYEEFLKNRDSRGIHDLVHLDLIPKLDIYRSDLLPADVRMSSYPSPAIAAVLVSHAHVDHTGNIGLLDIGIPIIASPLSLAIMKGMQDSGISSAETDAYYVSPKLPIDESGLLLESERKMPHTCRASFCTTGPDDALIAFLSHRPGQDGKNAKKYQPAACLPLGNAALPFKVTPYEVDHSIFGATAYLLQGDSAIAYTGDLRLHGRLGDRTRDFVHHAKDASVLITEGTRAGRDTGPEGEGGSPTSERLVYETCRAACDDVHGLIVADFSPRNFERLETFLQIARETGRTLVVTSKDLYLLHALECADGVCRFEPVGVYRELADLSRRKWETEVVMDRASGQYVSYQELHENPDQYIACFSFYDAKHLLDIKPNGGSYLYSSCEAFSEEMEIDFRRLWQWIHRFGLEARGFSVGKQGELSFDPGFHASGHASREDLAWVIDQVDPEILIPVHTTGHDWFADTFENVRVLGDGERIEL